MHYVIADIHGCYDLYLKMLEKIGFSDGDTLYFLGDAIDRGPDGIKVLLDMMGRKNIVPFLGNHEDMFYRIISSIGKELTLDEKIDVEGTMEGWINYEGGDSTWADYCSLPEDQKQALLAYLKSFRIYKELKLNGRRFLLAHAGLGRYAKGKTPDDCTAEEMIWERMDYDKVYWPNVYLVTGHTPTGYIDPAYANRIMQKNNHIAVDCGAVFGGTLGCVCLETLEEFYVC